MLYNGEAIKTQFRTLKRDCPRPLQRKKTCEDFSREEVASEAAMWAYIRSHGGRHRIWVVEPGCC